jgi:hypothetical protein
MDAVRLTEKGAEHPNQQATKKSSFHKTMIINKKQQLQYNIFEETKINKIIKKKARFCKTEPISCW